jgi:hypothetical protein
MRRRACVNARPIICMTSMPRVFTPARSRQSRAISTSVMPRDSPGSRSTFSPLFSAAAATSLAAPGAGSASSRPRMYLSRWSAPAWMRVSRLSNPITPPCSGGAFASASTAAARNASSEVPSLIAA